MLVLRLAVSLMVGIACAVWSVYSISLLPPDVSPRQLEIGAAATHLLLDAEDSFILDGEARDPDFTSLAWRADLYGNLIATPLVRERIGRLIGVPGDQIAATPRLTAGLPDGLREPDSEQRTEQIRTSGMRYRLDVHPDPVRPVLHIYAQAPSAAAATQLADAAVTGLLDYLDDRPPQRIADGRRITIKQLGPARGQVINARMKPQMVMLAFLFGFAACFALLSAASAIRRGWGAGRGIAEAAVDGRARRPATATADAWPHTTRLLPWSVAGFMVILWWVPFNTIELTASLPFDLKLDRLVLPFIFGLWLLALATGGRNAPRVRLTPIHVAVAVLGLVVALSVVINATALNETLEFDLGFKKLSLIVSYGLFFLIVASSVRAAEVPAFLKLTLVLAVLAAVGTVWEHRMGYNVFYDVSDKLLPPFFTVNGASEAGLIDGQGRALTRGPGEHPLEIVAMLTMALPLTLVGMLDSRGRRNTILFGLATAVLMAAALSTNRKSSLLAPLAVGLMFAYYRRADLMKLAPLGVGLVFAVQFLAPGAVTSVLFQLSPDQLGVGTVSDRASDYDAVRPDFWSHIFLGRGYGTYDHVTYRILDSEALSRLVDTGMVGLLALFGVLVTIIAVSSGLLHTGDRRWSAPAIVAAPAALAYLVLSFLFDVSSFPHAPYILMGIAGLVAATAAARYAGEPAPELADRVEATRVPPRYIEHGAPDPDRVARAQRGGAHRASRKSRRRARAAAGALDHQR